ncbi:hypothetical protein [Microbacterium sp. NPDC089696]|uniref:hypothetical protein n=1 Tax=Microbacterium sp. NPDC089696 TaxID=3364199 RepID=UPI0037F1A8EC
MSSAQTPPPKPTRMGIVLGTLAGAVVAAPLTALILENQLLGLGLGAVVGGSLGGAVLAPFVSRRRHD